MLQKPLPILALLLILGGCGDDDDSENSGGSTASESTGEGAEAEGTEETTGTEEATGEGEPPGGDPAGPGEGEAVAPPATGPEGNLFSRGEIRLGVSSVGDAAEHGPARLVDGDPNTFWSSRASDAVGSWLAFRIPEGVAVSKIRIVAGRRASNGTWAPGPRIRKVEILHNGTSKGEFTITGARAAFHDIEVTGTGGLWQIVVRQLTAAGQNQHVSVAELEVIGRRGENSFDAFEPLPQRCRVGAVDSIFGQAVVGAEGLSARGSRNLVGDYSYGVDDVPSIPQELRDLAQGAHTGSVTPLRAIDFEGQNGNRVLFLLYGVDPNTASQRETRRSATRAVESGGHCYDPPVGEASTESEWIPCHELHLARFSLPASGLPSHDGSAQFGGDSCQIRELETEVRDFDDDNNDELLVRINSTGTPYCPTGNHLTTIDELFLRLEDGTPQLQLQLSMSHPDGARAAGTTMRGERSVRDVNSDGKPDIVFAAHTEVCNFEDGQTEPDCNAEDGTTNYIYNAEIDAWLPEGEEVQIEGIDPPGDDQPPAAAPAAPAEAPPSMAS